MPAKKYDFADTPETQEKRANLEREKIALQSAIDRRKKQDSEARHRLKEIDILLKAYPPSITPAKDAEGAPIVEL